MEIRNFTCIGCPLGCALRAEIQDGEVTRVTGNTCKRGDVYARKEVTHPTRIVTSTVPVSGSDIAMVSVKTEHGIPKEKIMDIMKCLDTIKVPAPVHTGDVILANAAGTGVNIIATRDAAAV